MLCRGRWELFDAEGKRASPTPACAGNAQSLGRVENGPTDGADSRAWWPVCTRGGEELMAQHRRRRRKQGAITTPDPLAGIGPQRPDDRRGWLQFESLPDAIQRAEDATLYNDYEHQPWRHLRERSATPTERLLLEHLGYTLPAELTTRVEHLSPTIRRRTWPQLETQEIAP